MNANAALEAADRQLVGGVLARQPRARAKTIVLGQQVADLLPWFQIAVPPSEVTEAECALRGRVIVPQLENLALCASPFEKGGSRGISSAFAPHQPLINPPHPPFVKGGRDAL